MMADKAGLLGALVRMAAPPVFLKRAEIVLIRALSSLAFFSINLALLGL